MQAGGLSDAERKAKGLLISSISSSKYTGIANKTIRIRENDAFRLDQRCRDSIRFSWLSACESLLDAQAGDET